MSLPICFWTSKFQRTLYGLVMLGVKKLMPVPRFEFTPRADPTGVWMPVGYGLLRVANGVTKLSLDATGVVVWLNPVVGPVRKAPTLLLNTPKPKWITVRLCSAPGDHAMPTCWLGKNDGN